MLQVLPCNSDICNERLGKCLRIHAHRTGKVVLLILCRTKLAQVKPTREFNDVHAVCTTLGESSDRSYLKYLQDALSRKEVVYPHNNMFIEGITGYLEGCQYEPPSISQECAHPSKAERFLFFEVARSQVKYKNGVSDKPIGH